MGVERPLPVLGLCAKSLLVDGAGVQVRDEGDTLALERALAAKFLDSDNQTWIRASAAEGSIFGH